jgi:D-alanine-D-alanine ligase
MGTGHIVAIDLMAFLEENGFVTSVNPTTAFLTKNKSNYKASLLKAGFPTAKFIAFDYSNIPPLEVVESEIGIPCVVKSPLDCMYPQKVNNIEELRAAIDEVGAVDSLLVEQYLYGVDYTLAVTNDGNEAKAWTIAYYSKAKGVSLKGFSGIYEGKLTMDQETEVKEVARRAVWDLGVLGLPRLDMITTLDGKHHILECNCVTVTGWGTPYVAWEKAVLAVVDESYVSLLVDTSMSIFSSKLGN